MVSLSASSIEILQELIRCPSVTPNEGGALAYLEQLLKPAGFVVMRPVFMADGTAPVENLFASFGRGRPHFVFAGHTDVVPPGDERAWRYEPFDAKIVKNMLYGRGAVDMKGGIACFAAAALHFIKTNPDFPGKLSFLITGDEEGPAVNGTKKLLEWCAEQGERFDHCIVGEPTNPQKLGEAVKVGRRGSLSGQLTVYGVQGHVAYPHLADNPVHKMIRLLQALTEAPLDEGTRHFEASQLQVVSIDCGNEVANVIPAELTARFNVRFNDAWTPASLEAELHRCLDMAASTAFDKPVDYKLEILGQTSDSFLTHSKTLISLLSQSIEEVTGQTPNPSTGGGTSDARFIKDYCPVVEFGLVGKTMHQVDECTSVTDLEQLTTIYLRFLERYFLGRNPPA